METKMGYKNKRKSPYEAPYEAYETMISWAEGDPNVYKNLKRLMKPIGNDEFRPRGNPNRSPKN